MENDVVTRRSDDGFTLMELLIVIVIIGILAGIAVFSVSGATKTSAVSACATDIRAVNAAVTAYSSDYPNSGADLTASPSLYGAGTLITNGYLSPLDSSNRFDAGNPQGAKYLLELLVANSASTNPAAAAYTWTIRVTGGSGVEVWDPLGSDPSGSARGLCNRVIS